MKRFITDKLITWKKQTRRKPLVLRGARQVGKTWSVKEFGEEQFGGNVHVVDLEQRPDWHRVFEGNLVASRLLSELEILLNRRIVPGQDLLFLDEVQSCPRALMALRYFYEERPELHVIAAGSLLEFAMRDISFPVGRVQFLEMHPMCFAEFLLATGKELAVDIVLSSPCNQPESVHIMLLRELRHYLFVGGMPECVLA
ncbi:MAG: AAA family ATPase, partial [Armatimonadetes bacterium]|nr:AAA family ATPase [Armatimonadota bacterium]